MKYIVYKTTYLKDNRFYIGSHCGLNADTDEYLGSGIKISSLVLKYGKENFKREIIELCIDENSMYEREEYWINYYYNNPLCLNLSKIAGGGDLGEFKYKPILQFSKYGELIRRYSSRKEANKEVPFSSKCHSVSKFLTQESSDEKNHSGGFLWVYEEDYENGKVIKERWEESISNSRKSNLIKSYPLFLLMMDIHLNEKNYTFIENLFDQAIKVCNENKIKFIFQAGDIFDNRKGMPLNLLICFQKIIEKLKKNNIIIISIAGNHDKVDLDSEDSYLNIFSSDHFRVLNKETTINWLHSDYDIHFLPYFKENGSYSERLNNIVNNLNKNKEHILITHIAINGVKNNDGSEINNNLSINLFNAFKNVYVAHYHNASKLSDNIEYLGSTWQMNFGEDDKKGFHIFKSGGELDFIQSNFPKYIKLKADISDSKAIKAIEKEYANSTDNIRIVFTGDESKMASLEKEKFSELGIDVKFDKEIIRQDLSAVVESNINFNSSNLTEAFNQFCELNDYDNKEIGNKYLEKIK